MKKRSNYQIYPLFFLFIFIISCGQNKTKTPQNSPGKQSEELKTIPGETSVNGNQAKIQNVEKPPVDPLFYIEGQLCQHLRRIFQDKSGNLWFGTNVYGLMRYNGDTLEYFSEKDGLAGGRITGIVEDAKGNVWFGSYGGLSKYDGKSFVNFTVRDDQINNDIWSLIIDSKGMFWIGTAEGVVRFNGEAFSSFPIPKAAVKDTTSIISYNRISCILEDKNGILWFGTDGFGICKYAPSASSNPTGNTLPDSKDFTLITKENGLPDNNVGSLMEDSKGNIWIGTMYGGVSRYDGETFTNYTRDGVIEGIEVGAFFEDKSGNIWFAAENFGVYRYDGNSFTNFNENAGLNTNGILSILEDREGRFWFGGWGGLFRFDGKSFFSVTKDGPWD